MIPEALGLVAGCVFLLCVVAFQVIYTTFLASRWHVYGASFESAWQVEFNAGMASICFMILLGFADDVLDIPWRWKLVLPLFAALPLLVGYRGHTSIALPSPLRGWPLPGNLLGGQVPHMLALGPWYKVALVLILIFCTNAINIHAGINGLEVGQTCVLASAVLTFSLGRLAAAGNNALVEGPHMLSVFLTTPLLATSLGLWYFNWYPATIFVGDTFTYFAGMVLGVAGVLGHFSETLMVLFLPQILNFVYSLPQLVKFVPCPRHRLPLPQPDGTLLPSSNYNLVNGFLVWFGPCTEPQLCLRLLLFQASCAVGTFALRHLLEGWYKV